MYFEPPVLLERGCLLFDVNSRQKLNLVAGKQ
jgi:hypothetical protein